MMPKAVVNYTRTLKNARRPARPAIRNKTFDQLSPQEKDALLKELALRFQLIKAD
jgi:hypothetical protein